MRDDLFAIGLRKGMGVGGRVVRMGPRPPVVVRDSGQGVRALAVAQKVRPRDRADAPGPACYGRHGGCLSQRAVSPLAAAAVVPFSFCY